MTTHLLRHYDIHCDISVERLRQERLKADGRFAHTCADAELTDPAKFLILAEELGEIAHAVKVHGGLTTNRAHQADLRGELVQLMAVAFAWVEAIDAEAGWDRQTDRRGEPRLSAFPIITNDISLDDYPEPTCRDEAAKDDVSLSGPPAESGEGEGEEAAACVCGARARGDE